MGCVESGSAPGGEGQTAVAPAAIRTGNGREVEAPEVFQVTDSALWDGRPSLGGIWVASPEVTDPERVVILNPATGKTVNGALFRRERDNPGPPLQVSSDAAEALGLLAGQPATLRVTALRKPAEAAPAPAAKETAVAAASAAEAASEPATDEVRADDAAAAETAALATAALAATGAAADAGTDAAAAATATAAADGADATVAPEATKPKTWKERRAEAKARREAAKAAKAAAAGAEATEGEAAEPAATADNAAVAAIETAPLDARTPEVAAAADAAATTGAEPAAVPKKTRRQLREEKEAAAALANAAAEAPAADAATAGASAGRPIQIASYSKEANATRAIEALARIGITGQSMKTEKNGQAVWSVVTTGDEAQLNAIRGAGFADAFFLQ